MAATFLWQTRPFADLPRILAKHYATLYPCRDSARRWMAAVGDRWLWLSSALLVRHDWNEKVAAPVLFNAKAVSL